MATPLATAFVRVRPDLSGFQKETEAGVARSGKASAATFGSNFSGQLRKGMPGWAQAGDKAGQSFGARFGASAGKLTANLAKVGLAAFVGAAYLAVKQGSALEDSQARLAVAMKNTGSDATAYAGQLKIVRDRMEMWGFTNADVNTSLGTLTTATGSIAKAMSAEATAANLARFKHMDLASASDVLAKAFAGNMRSLKGLNVIVATGATSDKAMAKAQLDLKDQIASAGGMAKFAAAHHMTLAQAQKLTGAAAAGSIPAMNKLGLVVLPASATAADRFAQVTRTLNSRLGGQAAAAAGTAGGKFGILKTQLTDMAAQIGVMVLPKLIAVLSWLQKSHLVIPLLAVAMGVLTAAFIAQAIAIQMTPVGWIADAIIALIAVVILLKTHWRTVWKFVVDSFNATVAALHGAWSTVVNFLSSSWQRSVNTVRSLFRGLVLTLLGFFGNILDGAAKMLGWVPGVGGKLKGAAGAFRKFRDDVNAALGGVNGHTVHVGVAFAAAQSGHQGPAYAFPKATGGPITGPGGPTDDRAGLFALSNDEYVVRASAHRKYGTQFLDRVNAGRLAAGGSAGGINIKPATPSAADIAHAVGVTITAMAKAFASTMMGSGAAVAAYARRFGTGQGHPYVWGGTSPSGWDCSGFSSYVYHHFGYGAPRTSQQQQTWARPSGQQPGALVFFYGDHGNATHVGIALGGGKMVNASSPAVGTIISGVGGNTGFGIPPGGFKSTRGGSGAAPGGGTYQDYVRSQAASRYGWSGIQWTDLNRIISAESSWRLHAHNASGASGLFQDITGTWGKGSLAVQTSHGLAYIRSRYGNPASAWGFHLAHGWYDQGGWVPPGVSVMHNQTGHPERVLSPDQNAGLEAKLDRIAALLERLPARTGAATGAAIGGVTRGAAAAGYYGTRP